VDYADNESTTSFESLSKDFKRKETKKISKENNKYSSSEVLTSSPDM
jgi:hypothetical protein